MMLYLENALAALPIFASHLVLAIVILVSGIGLYIAITPYHELKLVKAGNRAASIVLSGAIVGLAIPVSEALRHSLGLYDILIWGVVAISVQLITYGGVNLILRGIKPHIENDEFPPALTLAACQIAVGLMNGAAMGG